MAYTPPHKRHSENSEPPSPTLLPSQLQRNPKHRFNKDDNSSRGKIGYAQDSISRWFVVPSNDAHLPCSLRIEQYSNYSVVGKDGRKPFIIVRDVADDHTHREMINYFKDSWVPIVEKIQDDLLTSFEKARSEMGDHGNMLNVPRFLIRFGKVLFHGPSITLDNIDKTLDVEDILSRLKKRYYTNLPESFVEAIVCESIPKLGLNFQVEKVHYYVMVFDKSRPDSIISCKCSLIVATGELDLFKIELKELRQMVTDISCLDKDLDIRLLLSSKRIMTSLSDEENHALTSLMKSAIIDSEVKGGLRWPLGKESFGDRFTVVGAWHTKTKRFESSYMRLKLKHADRFDFITLVGEPTVEVSLRIPELTRQLRDETLELFPLIDMVRDALKLVWDNFLCWKGSFT